jgi:hypothetical protein
MSYALGSDDPSQTLSPNPAGLLGGVLPDAHFRALLPALTKGPSLTRASLPLRVINRIPAGSRRAMSRKPSCSIS